MNQRFRSKKIIWCIFILYLIFMVWVLFGRNRFDVGKPYWEEVQLNINLLPFSTIKGYLHILINNTNPHLVPHALLNLVGNVVAFIPLGFFVSHLFVCEKTFRRFLFHNILLISFIELIQLFTLRGSCDIDDLILNISGSIIGFFIQCLVWRWLGYVADRRNNSRL